MLPSYVQHQLNFLRKSCLTIRADQLSLAYLGRIDFKTFIFLRSIEVMIDMSFDSILLKNLTARGSSPRIEGTSGTN